MKIGYNQACGLGCSTLEEDLELCEAVGFDVIEIRFDMVRDYLVRNPLSRLVSFFEQSKLEPGPLNASYLYPEFLEENGDVEKRDRFLNEFMMACAVAQNIGAPGIVVVPPLQRDPLGGPYPRTRDETDASLPRILSHLADLALSFNLRLAFEPVGFERSSVRSVSHAAELVRSSNRKNIGFTIDSYNLFLNDGDNEFTELAESVASDIEVVHLMTADILPPEEWGQDKRRFPDFDGAVDIEKFLSVLQSIGYDGIVSVETFRTEYWEKSPRWVVETAYQKLFDCLQHSGWGQR